MSAALATPEELEERLRRAGTGAASAGLDALLITPGPDLRYLLGYDAVPLERLTCLIVPGEGGRGGRDPGRGGRDPQPVLVVPRLEIPAAAASPARALGVEIIGWDETDDAYALVARLVGAARRVGLDDRMWAAKALRLRDAMPGVAQGLAGEVITALRMRKSAAEVAALAGAGAAIDRVHERVPALLRPGRTEREVGQDIAEAILEEGHATVDFVIVASGPHGASPHHEVSDRVLERGDAVVVDIGGTMPDGYCSDETRMYALGDPGAEYLRMYAALQEAQRLAVAAIRPGVTCEAIDAIARQHLVEHGLGDYFIHRTGHGIGLETHEDPYIVAGNTLPLEPGMTFSVEPGYYIDGRFGARIEDIVACGDEGPVLLNDRPRELCIVDA